MTTATANLQLMMLAVGIVQRRQTLMIVIITSVEGRTRLCRLRRLSAENTIENAYTFPAALPCNKTNETL